MKLWIKSLLVLLFLVPAQPAAAERFFEALYDVPVMAGLEEIPGESMLFDVPDGRIATVVAASERLEPSAVSGFYAAVLPQLGWKKTDKNQYVRDGAALSFEIARKNGVTAIQFTLSPSR